MNIAVWPAHIDYDYSIRALEADDRIDVIRLSEDYEIGELPETDVLILQMIEGSFPDDLIQYYHGNCKTIVWQTGIWPRMLSEEMFKWIDVCDFFMGYDEIIEMIALRMGKKIWEEYPLLSDSRAEIISPFIDRTSMRYIYSANKFHPLKFGYSLLLFERNLHPQWPDLRYIIYYDPTHVGEWFLNLPLESTEFRENVEHAKFLEDMTNECKLIFQIADKIAWGQNIIDSIRLGIPSISNTFYQRIFYPNLQCSTIREAQYFFEQDYNFFEKHVANAQQRLKSLGYSKGRKRFADYLFHSLNERSRPGGPYLVKDLLVMEEHINAIVLEHDILEIGCLEGKSTSVLVECARAQNKVVYVIDPFFGGEESKYQEDIAYTFIKNMIKFNYLDSIRLFPMTSQKALDLEMPDKISVLHIDGSHLKNNILSDLKYMERLQGLAIFHDIDFEEVADALTEIPPQFTQIFASSSMGIWSNLE